MLRILWLQVIFVLLFVGCLGQNGGEPSVYEANKELIQRVDDLINKHISDGESKLESTTTLSTTSSNPLASRICQTCHCETGIPFQVDCGERELDEVFQPSDWSSMKSTSSMNVNFSRNNLTEILAFDNLPITALAFHDNSISTIQGAAFELLSQLEYLDLSKNSLTHQAVHRKVFQGPFSQGEYDPIPLKTLRLGYNDIHSLNSDVFEHTPLLEVLELNNNPISVIDHQTAMAISSLRNLRVLHLAETGLSSISGELLHSLRKLSTLILNGNHFKTVPVELQHAVNLVYLNFNNNPITELNSESFRGLNRLKQLNISSMANLGKIGMNTFTPLKSLETLWCSFNLKLKLIHSAAFKGIAPRKNDVLFRQFHFRGNAVERLSVQLLPWDLLDVIDIQENPFYCDCRVAWIVENLTRIINDKSPDYTLSIICSEPGDYSGRSLMHLNVKSLMSNCPSGVDEEDSDFSDADDQHTTKPTTIIISSTLNVGVLIVSLLGVFLVIAGLAAMSIIAIRKRHLIPMIEQGIGETVLYVRAKAEEDPSDRKLEDERAILPEDYLSRYSNQP